MSLPLFAMLLAGALSAATLPPSAPSFDAPVPAGDDAAGEGPSFSPSVFTFKSDVADDGTGDGGGWQVADAKLNFFDWEEGAPEVLDVPPEGRDGATHEVEGEDRRSQGGADDSECRDAGVEEGDAQPGRVAGRRAILPEIS
jgi:hypothetical protein